MQGLTKEAIEREAARDGSPVVKGLNARPKDAATLILLRGKPGKFEFLMGRRSLRHKFMPGLFVFPGGRVDPDDATAPAIDNLHPLVEAKLLIDMKGRPSARRARAMALAAIRETYEEAGIFLGRKLDIDPGYTHPDWQGFADHRVAPALSGLRLVARAITPPGRIRRYDTRFFATFAEEEVAHTLPDGKGPTDELEDIHWMTFDKAYELELPGITREIIREVEKQITDDPALSPDRKVPTHFMRHNRFLRVEV